MRGQSSFGGGGFRGGPVSTVKVPSRCGGFQVEDPVAVASTVEGEALSRWRRSTLARVGSRMATELERKLMPTRKPMVETFPRRALAWLVASAGSVLL